jgi:hypothetical protein
MITRAAQAFLCFGLFASIAGAAAINCNGVSDVTTIGSDGCAAPGASDIVFSSFIVVPSAGYTAATIGITTANVVDNVVFLNFSIGGITGPGAQNALGDILLYYTVTGGLTGLDMTLEGTTVLQGGFMRITEIGCDAQFELSVCGGNTIANFLVTWSGGAASHSDASFNLTDPVYIKKDIQFNGATSSEFTNSHEFGRVPPSEVPEPVTLSMVGLGLLGIGILGHRRGKG